MAPRDEGLVVQRAIRIRATPERVLNAFFNPDDLAKWWEVSRSVTLARPLGPFAVEWPATDFTDEVLGKLGGTLHGVVMDVSPGVSFFVADLYYQPPNGHTIGPMALNVQARPLDAGDSTELAVRLSADDEGPLSQRYFAIMGNGWDRALEALQVHLEWARGAAAACRADVVIIGGGVVGSSVGWHLREHGFTGRIVVVERDRSYFRASSFLAMGGIRQQFCTAVTVQMVQHSVAFWKKFDQRMGTPRARPRAWFRQRGYLFLADAATAPALMRRYELERRAGARVRMLAPDEIRELVPDAWLDDIIFGMLGPEDGYANPREVLSGFQRAAEAAGVEYLEANVASLTLDGSRVTGVVLEDGTSIAAGVVVNAAGAWAGHIAAHGRADRAGVADAADAVPLHAAQAMAASLPDADRSGRRALAPRRPGGTGR